MKISIILKPNGFMRIIPYFTKDLYECNERLYREGDQHNDPIEKTWYCHVLYRRHYYNPVTSRDKEIPVYMHQDDAKFISPSDIIQALSQLNGLGVTNV